jgi:hypothetical protein
VAILDCQTVLRARAVMEAIGRCIDSTTKPLPCLRRMFLDKIVHFVESGRGHCLVYRGFRGIGRGKVSTKR